MSLYTRVHLPEKARGVRPPEAGNCCQMPGVGSGSQTWVFLEEWQVFLTLQAISMAPMVL